MGKNAQAEETCASRLRILADRTRLHVLRELVHGPKNVGQLNEKLRIPQSLLSHHLRILREAELIASKRLGKSVQYSVTPAVRGKSLQTIDLGCCQLSFE